VYIKNTENGELSSNEFYKTEPIIQKINNKIEIVEVSTKNEILAISNLEINDVENIKYNLIKVNSLISKQLIKLFSTIKDINGKIFDFNDRSNRLPNNEKLFVHSNIPFNAIVLNGKFVIYSSNICFEKAKEHCELQLNFMSFGILNYKYHNLYVNKKKNKINLDEVYLNLYRCVTPNTNVDIEIIDVLYLLSNINYDKNSNLYRLIEFWIKTNEVPLSAIKYLKQLRLDLGGLSVGV
jgi:hypothetical protein